MGRPLNQFNASEKILHHADKLDYFINGHKTLVVTELDLTNRCNNECPGCIGGRTDTSTLSVEQIDLIVDGLAALGNRGVIVSGGGEPLVSPHFVHAIERLARAGMRIGVNSNGLALEGAAAEAIARYADYLRVSLDAATPETYLQTHGMRPEHFERVLSNIRAFNELRAHSGSSVNFGLGFLTNAGYEAEMEPSVALARDLGVDFAQFRPYQDDTFNAIPEVERLRAAYERPGFSVLASAQKYGHMADEERGYSRCHGMFFSTVITADARVFACLHYRQRAEYEIGQIGPATLPEIWRSARKWAVYESIDCAGCPVRCRNDSFNRTLESLTDEVPDIEFM